MHLIMNPLVRKLLFAAVAVFVVWAYGAYSESQGYNRASLECDLKIEKIKSEQLELTALEAIRQQEANDSAKRREAELIKEIDKSSKGLDQILLELSIESIKDIDANNGGINASSVRRLSKIQ